MIRVDDSDAPVVVQHRLALGVTPVNSLTGAAIGDVAVVHESPIVGLGRRHTRADPLAAEVTGERVPGTRSGRFRLLLTPRLGRGATLLLFDDARRFVARRFDVPLWSPARLTAPEAEPPGAFVPTAQRVFAPTLWPGSAYPLPVGTTGLRGRVVRADGRTPACWTLLVAGAPDAAGPIVGRAHGDDRGEFLMMIAETGIVPPPRSRLAVTLTGYASAAPEPTPGARQRLVDLPTERVAAPGEDGYPRDPLLRGETPPPGYLPHAGPEVTLLVGTITSLAAPLVLP